MKFEFKIVIIKGSISILFMNKNDYINYWIKTSEDDIDSMISNFESGKYDWALFIGHLALEKILKALWVKRNTSDFPPKTHNLRKIAVETKYPITESEDLFLVEINDFNLEARYPDYKFEFYKKCTKDFSKEYILRIQEFHKCIVNLI